MNVDLAIIGGGPAGLAAAIAAHDKGIKNIIIIEREKTLGGILNQCIHHGFGLHTFGEELTGPEYALRYIEMLKERSISYMTLTMVVNIISPTADHQDPTAIHTFHLTAIEEEKGEIQITARAIILAMGCRERPRGALNIPGLRPAGIFSAGTAQRFVNIEGYLPGKNVVILGSGDIGLIMARRMHLQGAKVKMVVEILPHSGGLTRNVVQCLDDFSIPLKMSHTITNIHGTQRLTGVTIAAVEAGAEGKLVPIPETAEYIPCDTLLISCGLIPENELSRAVGAKIDEVTHGPIVNANFETTVRGIFACGNVLHVHDLVDNVSIEASATGVCAAEYLTALQAGEVLPWGETKRPKIPPKSRYTPSTKRDFENEIVCIGCPNSCLVRASTTLPVETLAPDASLSTAASILTRPLSLSGHACPIGHDYALKEMTAPHRNLTSLVRVTGGERTVVSVKTAEPIPKGKISTCMDIIRHTTVTAPIRCGDILIENIADTRVDIVATTRVD